MNIKTFINPIQKQHLLLFIGCLCTIIFIMTIMWWNRKEAPNTLQTPVKQASLTIIPSEQSASNSKFDNQHPNCKERAISMLPHQSENNYVADYSFQYKGDEPTSLYLIDRRGDECNAYLAFDYKTELNKLGYKITETHQQMRPIAVSGTTGYFVYHDYAYELSFWSYEIETNTFNKIKNISDAVFGKSTTSPLYSFVSPVIVDEFNPAISFFILPYEGDYCIDAKPQDECIAAAKKRIALGDSKVGLWMFDIRSGKVHQLMNSTTYLAR